MERLSLEKSISKEFKRLQWPMSCIHFGEGQQKNPADVSEVAPLSFVVMIPYTSNKAIILQG
jgi:hypothetical protein